MTTLRIWPVVGNTIRGRVTYLLIICICILTFTGCKKDKLQDEYSALTGEWEWLEDYSYLSQIPTSESYTKTIDLKENGTYKISIDGKIIEKGRIIIRDMGNATAYNFLLEFKRNAILTTKQEFIGLCGILFIGTDTMLIGTNLDWTHQPYHRYKRKK
jgi:hypothetical protein